MNPSAVLSHVINNWKYYVNIEGPTNNEGGRGRGGLDYSDPSAEASKNNNKGFRHV